MLGWLLLVAAIFVARAALRAKNVPSYDAGQSGVAEQTLHRLGVASPPAESVLIQRAGAAGRRTFAHRPGHARRRPGRSPPRWPRCRTRRGTSPRRWIRGHPGLVSADGRSALVTFTVPGT